MKKKDEEEVGKAYSEMRSHNLPGHSLLVARRFSNAQTLEMRAPLGCLYTKEQLTSEERKAHDEGAALLTTERN
jgi:hypothetical protein